MGGGSVGGVFGVAICIVPDVGVTRCWARLITLQRGGGNEGEAAGLATQIVLMQRWQTGVGMGVGVALRVGGGGQL